MEHHESLFTLSIDNTAKSHLNDTARWAKFLAIAGMVFLVIALAASILSVTVLADSDFSVLVNDAERDQFTTATKIGTVVGMLMMLIIAFFPLLFLLQFSNKLRSALRSNNQEAMNLAFLNLKKYFRYIGIIMIIILSIYALVFFVAFLFGSFN